MTKPLVTVVIPARNEERYLAAAVDSVAAQGYPLDAIEVIVVDGGSTDATASVARAALALRGFRSTAVVSNLAGATPSNLNAGLAQAAGEVLVRLDARSRMPRSYLRRCVAELALNRAAVVGGRQVAVANGTGLVASGIARALNNRYAMGGSRYRRAGSQSGPTDTVYLGAFRTDELLAVGGWAEDMASNQDFELNRRLAEKLDLPVWFCSDLAVSYVGRARLVEIARQYHRFGRWKVRYWRSRGTRPSPRQTALVAAPLAVAGFGAAATAVAGPRLRLGLSLGAFAGALAVDELGSAARAQGLAERIVAVIAMALVGGGWWSGVVRQWLRRPTQLGNGTDGYGNGDRHRGDDQHRPRTVGE